MFQLAKMARGFLTSQNAMAKRGRSGYRAFQMKAKPLMVQQPPVEQIIRLIRGQRVILDSDPAQPTGET